MAEIPTKICLICGGTAKYAHFGIDSCRSCADFFKRTATSNKEYACRQGTRKCEITKKFICRRCRFDKCKDLGMSLDEPQNRKLKVDEVRHRLDAPSTSAEPLSADTYTASILHRIAREHTAALNRCKSKELSIRPYCLREHVRVPHEHEDLLLCTWSFFMECLKIYAVEYYFLAAGCFREFEKLTLEEKRLMLQSCAIRLYILESHFLTIKMFRAGPQPCRKGMITLTTCFDRDNVEFFIKDSNPTPRHRDIVSSMTFYVNRLETILFPLLRRIELTDTEFHALFGLVAWQLDPSQQLPERLHEIAKKVRQDIYTDLHRYYREELQLDNYSVRMGNLLMLDQTIQEANAMKAEEIQTYNLLDMLQADISFLQLIFQIKL